MSHVEPSERLEESDWLEPRLSGYHSVTSVVPDGFPAYVRILHPARSRNNAPVRWAQIAGWSGRVMHRLAEFHRIRDPLPSFGGEPEPWDDGEPETGNLAPDLMRMLYATLRDYTTSDACWFCVWDGYSDMRGSTAPTVILPGRGYLLFGGPLTAAMNTDWSPGGSIFARQSPNLFWPQDRSWCVGSEIDLHATLVGGPLALANALVANPALEAWRVEPTDPVTSDSDRLNSESKVS
jgi:hypothetical protein